MDITYKVRATDGQEYGPVTLEQLTGWLSENRINGDNEITRSDMSHWAKARDFAELQSALPVIVPPAVQSPVRGTPAPISARPAAAAAPNSDPVRAAQLKSGASWFYWIAALSLINSIVALTGSNWRFVIGLGVTQISDAVGQAFGGGGKFAALVVAIIAAGIFILCGIFANKRQLWAFIVGMILFTLDAVISLLISDWIGLGFHAFALFFIFRGFNAARGMGKA
jgi:hypothetical protein